MTALTVAPVGRADRRRPTNQSAERRPASHRSPAGTTRSRRGSRRQWREPSPRPPPSDGPRPRRPQPRPRPSTGHSASGSIHRSRCQSTVSMRFPVRSTGRLEVHVPAGEVTGGTPEVEDLKRPADQDHPEDAAALPRAPCRSQFACEALLEGDAAGIGAIRERPVHDVGAFGEPPNEPAAGESSTTRRGRAACQLPSRYRTAGATRRPTRGRPSGHVMPSSLQDDAARLRQTFGRVPTSPSCVTAATRSALSG